MGARELELALDLGPGEAFEAPPPTSRRRPAGAGAAGAYESQPVTATDVKRGRIRIPQDGGKGLFPSEPTEVSVVLRGTQLTARWNPRYGRHDRNGERSGQLSVGPDALAGAVKAGERLRLRVDADAVRLD